MGLTTLNFNVPLAAAAFVPNLFDTQPGAQIFRQLPRRTFIQIYACQNIVTTQPGVVCQLTFGNVIRVPESTGTIQQFTTGFGPTEQDHKWYEGGAEMLDQVILSVRNSDTIAQNARFRVKYE